MCTENYTHEAIFRFWGFFGIFHSIAVSPKLRSKLVNLRLLVEFLSQRDLFCRYRPRVLVWSFYIYLVKIGLVVNCVRMSPKVFKISCFMTWLILTTNVVKIGIWMLTFRFKISIVLQSKESPTSLDFRSKQASKYSETSANQNINCLESLPKANTLWP